MSDDVELEEVISAGIEHRLIDVHKAQPARVESYNASANTVTVTPMLYRQIPTDDGDYVAEALPQIPDVKVQFPRAGGFAITFPIQKGDFVLLVFCDTSTAAWRQNGQAGDPGDPERHGLSGAIAIPGVFPDQQNIASPSTSNMVMGKIGTLAAQIEITPSGVNIGAGASKAAARNGDKLTASAPLGTWAGVVEGAINSLAPGTFTPLNQFAGALPANPGGANNLGAVSQGSAHVNIED